MAQTPAICSTTFDITSKSFAPNDSGFSSTKSKSFSAFKAPISSLYDHSAEECVVAKTESMEIEEVIKEISIETVEVVKTESIIAKPVVSAPVVSAPIYSFTKPQIKSRKPETTQKEDSMSGMTRTMRLRRQGQWIFYHAIQACMVFN